MAIDDDERHRTNVLLEDIRAGQKAMFEGMTAMGSMLRAEFREELAKVHVRLEALESAVKQNTAEIKQSSADIRELREELRRLRHEFNHREELARIASLEERVTALEQR